MAAEEKEEEDPGELRKACLHIEGSFRVAEQTKRGVFAQMWRSRAWVE